MTHVSPSTELQRCRQVVLDGRELSSWRAFHDVFAREFHFFAAYGRNMDAWIDCMSSLADDGGVTSFALRENEYISLHIHNFEEFYRTSGDIASALLECTAFVNRRYESWNSRTRISMRADLDDIARTRPNVLRVSCAAGPACRSRSGAAVAGNDVRRIEWRTSLPA